MKFDGTVGFWREDVEVKPGLFKSLIQERPYVGDVLKDRRSFKISEYQNNDFTISNQISILADLYLQTYWTSIKYVKWKGVKWSVSHVNVEYPRITLTLGGVYNGTETTSVT